MNIYETDKLLSEYLLFHYGQPGEILPYPFGPVSALDFAVRCVSETVNVSLVPEDARALDLGCAVGRSSFELARHCKTVVGIDYSQRFIEAASRLGATGELDCIRIEEGEISTQITVRVPDGIERSRVRFEQGDAMNLRADLGTFDVVLMANLIDRLSHPLRCLEPLASLVNPGGQLVITSPYTWLKEFTAPENWLGGRTAKGAPKRTLDGLRDALEPAFELCATKDLPFLIREHARKFQWSIAEASMWRRV